MFTDQLCRVFISYTGQDLEEFAKSVRDEIRQWQWIAVDHKDWDATGKRSVKECRERVRKADALIVIVAHRYGWVPSGGGGGRTNEYYSIGSAVGKGSSNSGAVVHRER